MRERREVGVRWVARIALKNFNDSAELGGTPGEKGNGLALCQALLARPRLTCLIASDSARVENFCLDSRLVQSPGPYGPEPGSQADARVCLVL
jgi:hypothetical protein